MAWVLDALGELAMELVAALLAALLGIGVSMGRRSHDHSGGPSARTAVTYGAGLKVFSVVTTLGWLAAAVVAARSTTEPAEAWVPWVFVAIALPSACLVWESFLCRHEVTPEALRHASPWRGRYRMPWSTVREVKFLPSMYVIQLEDVHGEKRWVSLMMSRLGLFADHLLAGVPEQAIAEGRTKQLLHEWSGGELPELPI